MPQVGQPHPGRQVPQMPAPELIVSDAADDRLPDRGASSGESPLLELLATKLIQRDHAGARWAALGAGRTNSNLFAGEVGPAHELDLFGAEPAAPAKNCNRAVASGQARDLLLERSRRENVRLVARLGWRFANRLDRVGSGREIALTDGDLKDRSEFGKDLAHRCWCRAAFEHDDLDVAEALHVDRH